MAGKVSGLKRDLAQKPYFRDERSEGSAAAVPRQAEPEARREKRFPHANVYKKIFLFKDFVLPLQNDTKVMNKVVKYYM